MKKVTIDSINLNLTTEEDLCAGTLKIFLTTKRSAVFIPSISLEKAFSINN